MKRLSLLLAPLAFVGGVHAAAAADLPVKAPPPVVAVYNWNGFYVGGNAGGIYGHNFLGNSLVPGSNIVPNAVTLGNLAGTGGLNGSSAIGGAQIGYNWQMRPNWVWGVEADIQGMNMKENRTSPIFTVGANSAQDFDQVKHDWLATFRGRVGYTWNYAWFYVTGGLAVGNTSFSRTQTWNFVDGCAIDPRNGFGDCHVGLGTKTAAGATAGAGVEYLFGGGKWSAKLEYLHVWLPEQPNFVTQNSGAFVGGAGIFQRFNQRIGDSDLDIVRVGLNYHFYGPVVAKY